MRFLSLLMQRACAAGAAGGTDEKCRGPDVAFTMRSYAYIARLRCIDGRAVTKSSKLTSARSRDGCYADIMQVNCEGDPKWTQFLFTLYDSLPAPPLGFKIMSESAYI